MASQGRSSKRLASLRPLKNARHESVAGFLAGFFGICIPSLVEVHGKSSVAAVYDRRRGLQELTFGISDGDAGT